MLNFHVKRKCWLLMALHLPSYDREERKTRKIYSNVGGQMNHIFANFYFLGESFFWDVMMMYFSIHPNLEFGEKICVFLWGW